MQKLNQFKVNLPFKFFQSGTIRGSKLIGLIVPISDSYLVRLAAGFELHIELIVDDCARSP